MKLVRSVWMVVLVALAGACNGSTSSGGGGGEPVASASASASEAGGERESLLEAEWSRNAAAVKQGDLENRDVSVRRAAARALARIRGEAARAGLLRLLSDEDPQVVAWAAYGLGDACDGQREPTVSALTAARAALLNRLSDAGASEGGLDAHRSIVRAVGRCASNSTESVLAGWARERSAYGVDAIHALGDLVRERKRLREETFVALLEVAAGNASQAPVPDALYPFGRAENLPPSVLERTLDVASKALATKGGARAYAVRALARCDDAAVNPLTEILVDRQGYTALERAEAARGLARFARKGQRALAAALKKLVTDDFAKNLDGREVGVVSTILAGLTDVGKARVSLDKLAKLETDAADEAAKRRVSLLRCGAAQLMAERNFDMPLLRACDLSLPEDKRLVDPIESSIAARAVVAAIGVDGVKLSGKRLTAWRAYASGGDLRARQAAIELLAEHAEVPDAADVLAQALAAEQSGVVAAAATVLAKQPERALVKVKKANVVDDGIAKALHKALEGKGPSADVETLAEVISAAGAVAPAGVDKPLSKLCASPNEVVRERAIKALATLLGDVKKVRCAPPGPLPLLPERDHLVTGVVKIELDSDAGKLGLELDPTLALLAVTRVSDLVAAHYYDGMVVHRVVPGFVSQFGSPTADGYGGADGKAALPCETSPLPFGPLTVGVALAGRDTGSSQLFVTHAAYPHLDGKYAILGKATGDWDALVEGDKIRAAKLLK